MKDVLYCNLVTLFLTDGKFANLTADNTDLHGSEKETPTTEARRRGENSTINGFCKVKNGLFIAAPPCSSVMRFAVCAKRARLKIAERLGLLSSRGRSLLLRDGVINDDLLYALIVNDLGSRSRGWLSSGWLRIRLLLLETLLNSRLLDWLLHTLHRLLYGRGKRGIRRFAVIFPLRSGLLDIG
jgi:hypothetical protein